MPFVYLFCVACKRIGTMDIYTLDFPFLRDWDVGNVRQDREFLFIWISHLKPLARERGKPIPKE